MTEPPDSPRIRDPLFDLTGRVAVITGGAGMLGRQHADAIAAAGGIPVVVDVAIDRAEQLVGEIADAYGAPALALAADITDVAEVRRILHEVLGQFSRIDILINNAANNPRMEDGSGNAWSRLENFALDQWNQDIAVGLTGAFLCSQVFGAELARQGKGVILNVASDLAVIAPDQRIYRQPTTPEDQQPAKPVSYSVVKAGVLGLTRYLATYWAGAGVRVNALSPGGVHNDQPAEFIATLSRLIPLGRMAAADEYQGAVLFLCSDASSYMTGQNLIVDGGRTAW